MSLGQDSKDLLKTVAAMLSNRAELLGLEFAEERQRIVSAIVFGIVAAILAVFFLLGLSFLALMLLWDSPYRYAVVGGVTVLYAVLALVCIAKVKGLFSKNMPFAATVQVFKDDAAKIKGEMLTAPPFTDGTTASGTPNRSKEV
ncbi:MAG: phage holin family protein [Alcaligenaceae bacterium]|nr:phage holin family protein [Alcaligenaceae bacterium]